MNGLSTVAQLLAGGGVCTFLGSIVSVWSGRRKRNAENDKILSLAAMDLLKPAREQIEFLRKDLATALAEISSLRTKLASAENEIDALRHQIRTLQASLST